MPRPITCLLYTSQLLFVLVAIIVGARLGGIGLGVMGGVGLAILTFVFGLQPTAPPVSYTHLDVYKRQVLHGVAPISAVHSSPASVKGTVAEI